jgi:hypothetical protein
MRIWHNTNQAERYGVTVAAHDPAVRLRLLHARKRLLIKAYALNHAMRYDDAMRVLFYAQLCREAWQAATGRNL